MNYTKDFAKYYISYQDNLREDEKVTLLNFVNEASDTQVKYLLHFGKMYELQEITDILTESPLYDLGVKFKADRGQLQKKLWKATKELKSSMRGSYYAGKTPMQKHIIWQNKQKVIDSRFEIEYTRLDVSFKAARKKLMGGGLSDPSIKKGVTKVGGAVHGAGAVVVAAAIAVASYAIYKRFLSKSARSCSNKSGAEKTLCMQKYKKQATKARIRNMQSQMSKCAKTKDPAKCKDKTMSTIKHLQSKLNESYDRDFARYHIVIAEDLTREEKFEALEGLDQLSGGTITKFLTEAQGDSDVSAYWKHRNKIKKITGQKPVDSGVSSLKKAKAAVIKKKGFGSKIAAAIKAKVKVLKGVASAYSPKVAKGVKLAAKTM